VQNQSNLLRVRAAEDGPLAATPVGGSRGSFRV